MSLKVPKIFKRPLPIEEEIFVTIYGYADEQISFLLDKSTIALERGSGDLANKYMKGANIFYYLLHYGLNIYYFMGRESRSSSKPMIDSIEDKYKIVCVEDKLECLSAFYGVNYKEFWEKVTELLGIPRDRNEKTQECCVGISEMVIIGEECKVFKIGGCDYKEETGFEFADCEFVLEEFNVECNL